MPSFLTALLFLLNLPVFVFIQKRLFPEPSQWHRALSLAHPPELTHSLLAGSWREVLSHLRLAVFSVLCGLVFLSQVLLLKAWLLFTVQP